VIAKLLCATAALLAATASSAWAASIFVPNGDFETAPPDPNVDGDNNYTTGDVSPPWNGDNNYLESTNEAFTNPSTFVLGWQSNGMAAANGRYGLQQPRSGTGGGQLFYQRSLPAGSLPTGTLLGGFNGNLIGSMNMDDADGFDQEVQSGVLGNIAAGVYTLKVAVGARANANWNDVKYDIMLVANPTAGTLGTSGGTILGTPATQTLVILGTVPDTSNITELTYVLNVGAADPSIGASYAIRIAMHNTFVQNGVADPGAPVNGGTNARFTQGNFDNVRLDFVVPEPGATALALSGLIVFAVQRRRTR
jgi:opacity protein-like surface antigen